MINENNINIEFEKDLLQTQQKIQTFFKKSILTYIEKISDNAINLFNSSPGNIAYNYLNKVKDQLSKIDENIENINKLQNELNQIPLGTYNSNDSIKAYNENYIKYMKTITQNNLDIQGLLNKLSDYVKFDFSYLSRIDLLDDLSNPPAEKAIPKEEKIIEDTKKELPINQNNFSPEEAKKEQSSDENLKENVLLISDIKQKVVLPYTKLELENILNQNGIYNNIQEIIDTKYTIPISYYKNAPIARFKEAYSLVKKRSSGSIKEALDLGLEVFFKSDLNPAIITACKNIDELDIYLAYLDDNELDKFKCFDIVYETLPTVK